jgi:hypothetical protein
LPIAILAYINVAVNFRSDCEGQMLTANLHDALPLRKHNTLPNGTGYYRTNFIGRDALLRTEGPTCYLIEQEPDTTILPHFHRANQFQIFVAGHGRLGKQAFRPLTVHYTGAYTLYGPIIAQEDGVHYFTVRDAFDPGARWMPESRAEMPRVPRRHMMSEPLDLENVAVGTNDTVESVALGPEPDGLGALHVKLGAHARWLADGKAGAAGKFLLLLKGDATLQDRSLTSYGCVHLDPKDDEVELSAGDQGAQLLVLTFPRTEAHQATTTQ